MGADIMPGPMSETTGVLLTNLGTPDAPTTPALRRYLREFLWDPRVIELPRWKWWLILNLFVLTTRPKKSAAAYREVWTDEGSPLLVTGRRQAAKLQAALDAKYAPASVRVALGMRYGNPSIDRALGELEAAGCRRVLVLPLYPQYSATTTASTFDALSDALRSRRIVPGIRFVADYHDAPGYVGALANSIREAWAEGGEPEMLVFSFHGIPFRYAKAGDPYIRQCSVTAKLVRERLGRDRKACIVTFQSRFGKEPWVEPYTDETMERLGRAGLASLDVVCPGFSADCLETIEEIDQENREVFEKAGGGRFRYIPALNDRDDFVAALAAIVERNLAGWICSGRP